MSIDKPEEMTFECEYCKNTLSSKYRLQEHIKTCSAKKLFDDNKVLSLISSSKQYEKEFITMLYSKAIDNYDKEVLIKYKQDNLIDLDTFNNVVYNIIKNGDKTKIDFLSVIFDISDMCKKYIFTNPQSVEQEELTSFILDKVLKQKLFDYLDTTITENKKIITYYSKPLVKDKYYKEGDLLPTVQIFDQDDKLIREEYYIENKLFGKDAVKIYENRILIEKFSYKNNVLNSFCNDSDEILPAHVIYDNKGNVLEEHYYINGKLSRFYYTGEPRQSVYNFKNNSIKIEINIASSIIYENELVKELRFHNKLGQLSREGRPAIIRYEKENNEYEVTECEFYLNGVHQSLAKIDFKNLEYVYYVNKYISQPLVLFDHNNSNHKKATIEVVNDLEFNRDKNYDIVKLTFDKHIYIYSLKDFIICKVEEYYKIKKTRPLINDVNNKNLLEQFEDSSNYLIHREPANGPAQRVYINNKGGADILIERYFYDGKLTNTFDGYCWTEPKSSIFLRVYPLVENIKNEINCVENECSYKIFNNIINKTNTSNKMISNIEGSIYDDIEYEVGNYPMMKDLNHKNKPIFIEKDYTDKEEKKDKIAKPTPLIETKDNDIELVLKFPWDRLEDDEIDYFVDIYLHKIIANWEYFHHNCLGSIKYKKLYNYLLKSFTNKISYIHSYLDQFKESVVSYDIQKITEKVHELKEQSICTTSCVCSVVEIEPQIDISNNFSMKKVSNKTSAISSILDE